MKEDRDGKEPNELPVRTAKQEEAHEEPASPTASDRGPGIAGGGDGDGVGHGGNPVEDHIYRHPDTGEPVMVFLPFAEYWVCPGIDPDHPKGYRITFFETCCCCGRIFPNAEMRGEICPDCWKDGVRPDGWTGGA